MVYMEKHYCNISNNDMEFDLGEAIRFEQHMLDNVDDNQEPIDTQLDSAIGVHEYDNGHARGLQIVRDFTPIFSVKYIRGYDDDVRIPFIDGRHTLRRQFSPSSGHIKGKRRTKSHSHISNAVKKAMSMNRRNFGGKRKSIHNKIIRHKSKHNKHGVRKSQNQHNI